MYLVVVLVKNYIHVFFLIVVRPNIDKADSVVMYFVFFLAFDGTIS